MKKEKLDEQGLTENVEDERIIDRVHVTWRSITGGR
jgi:hypothetical protein